MSIYICETLVPVPVPAWATTNSAPSPQKLGRVGKSSQDDLDEDLDALNKEVSDGLVEADRFLLTADGGFCCGLRAADEDCGLRSMGGFGAVGGWFVPALAHRAEGTDERDPPDAPPDGASAAGRLRRARRMRRRKPCRELGGGELGDEEHGHQETQRDSRKKNCSGLRVDGTISQSMAYCIFVYMDSHLKDILRVSVPSTLKLL